MNVELLKTCVGMLASRICGGEYDFVSASEGILDDGFFTGFFVVLDLLVDHSAILFVMIDFLELLVGGLVEFLLYLFDEVVEKLGCIILVIVFEYFEILSHNTFDSAWFIGIVPLPFPSIVRFPHLLYELFIGFS